MAAKRKTGSKKRTKKRTRRRPSQKSKPRVPNRTGRPPKGTEDWGPPFLGFLQIGLHVREAAELACVGHTVVYERRRDDEAFRNAWCAAQEIGTQQLAAEAQRRAYNGVLKPVFQQGVQVGEIREYSDTLLMFLLRAREPNTYRDNSKLELVGKDGKELPGPVIYLPDNGRDRPESLEEIDADVGADDTAIGG